jgi:4-amino-4-deoxy-L-arabinose transferase-like glycosyltransferase
MPETTAGPSVRRGALAVGIVVLALAPFLGKAFTIDDPLFLHLARHLQRHPLDFFGFSVNWYGKSMPMHEVTMNPPGVGYFVAVAAALVGWSERALHAAFLLPAAACAISTFWIARSLTRDAARATLFALLTPAFLVSATTVMADVTMLALWLGAIACWLHGIRRDRLGWLALAGALAALAALTKYFAASAVPLLFAHGWLTRRRLGTWCLPLLIPVAALAAYALAGRALYGHDLLLGAAGYAREKGAATAPGAGPRLLVALAFLGGATVHALLLLPWTWRKIVSAAALALSLALAPLADVSAFGTGARPSYALSFQLLLLACGGLAVLALAVDDVRRERTPEAWLLAAWVAGTFLFAACANWVTNVRAFLPLAPAAGILLARRLEARGAGAWGLLGILPGAAVALLVARADAAWADDVRDSAAAVDREARAFPGRAYFLGHWGLQHYLEERGFEALDVDRDELVPGDVLILPGNNIGVFRPPPAVLEPPVRIAGARTGWLHTLDPRVGAGFHASLLGPLPFAFARSGPDEYEIAPVRRRFRWSATWR